MLNEMFKKFVVLAAAIAMESKNEQPEEPSLCRPSELPIYTEEEDQIMCENERGKSIDTEEVVLQYMENMVLKTQRKYEDLRGQLEILKTSGDDTITHARGNLYDVLQYLRQDEHSTQRAGAITLGALFGLLLGLRKGFLKKALYATTGASSVAAACYPEEAKELTSTALTDIKEILQASYELFGGGEQPEVIQQTVEIGEVKDPLEVIKESHGEAVEKNCHCPIGSCLHHSDEVPQSPDTTKQTTEENK